MKFPILLYISFPKESIEHFNLEGIGKSPSKLDMTRILSMNEHYIKNINENDLFDQLNEYCKLYKNEIKLTQLFRKFYNKFIIPISIIANK